MENNQNTMENTTEEKVTFGSKMRNFLAKNKKKIGIAALATLALGGIAAVAASKKRDDEEDDDISDVSWQDLETYENTESESTNSDAE